MDFHKLQQCFFFPPLHLFVNFFPPVVINAELSTVDNLMDLLECLNLFILNEESGWINVNPVMFGTAVLF